MNTKTVYHASPVRITKFQIPAQGLHVGDKDSAIQAIHYKRNKLVDGIFYLHKLVINIDDVEDVFDAGEDWRYALGCDTSKVYSYTNKYEPSSGKSFVMFDTKFIVETLSIEDSLLGDVEEVGYAFI